MINPKVQTVYRFKGAFILKELYDDHFLFKIVSHYVKGNQQKNAAVALRVNLTDALHESYKEYLTEWFSVLKNSIRDAIKKDTNEDNNERS